MLHLQFARLGPELPCWHLWAQQALWCRYALCTCIVASKLSWVCRHSTHLSGCHAGHDPYYRLHKASPCASINWPQFGAVCSLLRHSQMDSLCASAAPFRFHLRLVSLPATHYGARARFVVLDLACADFCSALPIGSDDSMLSAAALCPASST